MFQFNTLRPRQNGCHLADAIFKGIFVNENVWIPNKISLKFVPKGSINNNPALVQVIAWTVQATSHYLNQWWLDYRRIYASCGLNELRYHCKKMRSKGILWMGPVPCWPVSGTLLGGAFQKHLWALESKSSWIFTCCIKSTLWNSTQYISYPYIERYDFYTPLKIIKSS